MLFLEKGIRPGKARGNAILIIGMDHPLNVSLIADAKHGTAAIPYGAGDRSVHGSDLVTVAEFIRIILHGIDQNLVQ